MPACCNLLSMKKTIFYPSSFLHPGLLGLALLLPWAVFSQTVTMDTAFTQLFRQDCCGWTGSDGAISIPLDNGKTLWAMGDSYIGEVFADTSRPCYPESRLVNNALLLQEGNALATYFNDTDTSAYIPGTDTTLFWPGHGIQVNDTIYLFFYEIKRAGQTYNSVRLVKLDAHSLRILEITTLPDLADIRFGRYVLQEEGFFYIFGNRVTGTGLGTVITPYLARLSTNYSLGEFGFWEFYNGTGWSPDVSEAQSLFPAGETLSSYFSVLKLYGEYHLISQASFLGSRIYKWSSSQITGPYTNRTVLYNTQPFRDYNGCRLFTYNAMVHSQFNNEKGVLLSFNVIPDRSDISCSITYCGISCCPPCSFCLHPLVFQNADTYRPKFVRAPLCLFGDITETTQATICEGESYLLPDGVAATQAGVYEVALETASGCDSTIVVHLSVNPAYGEAVEAAICEGESYLLPDGVAATQPGAYEVALETASGCDSTIVVHLSVSLSPVLVDTNIIHAASGQANGSITPQFSSGHPPFEYLWSTGDTTVAAVGLPAGDYSLAVTDANGCLYEFSFVITGATPAVEWETDISLHAYPNPARDFLYLELASGGGIHEKTNWRLRDMNGRAWLPKWEIIGAIWRLDVSRIAPGVYVIDGFSGSRKFGPKRIVIY